jgi:hypothetical protein
MKHLFYFEEVETLFYNVVVVMQSMLLVLNYHLHSKEVVTWLKQKVRFIILYSHALQRKHLTLFRSTEFQCELREPYGEATSQWRQDHIFNEFDGQT